MELYSEDEFEITQEELGENILCAIQERGSESTEDYESQ